MLCLDYVRVETVVNIVEYFVAALGLVKHQLQLVAAVFDSGDLELLLVDLGPVVYLSLDYRLDQLVDQLSRVNLVREIIQVLRRCLLLFLA